MHNVNPTMNDLELGDDVELIVGERISTTCFRGLDKARPNWTFEIALRTTRNLEMNSVVKAWIFRRPGPTAASVSIEQFGRFPISDRMGPRYRAAVAEGLKYLKLGSFDDPAALSELKGMFNRIRRRDQWDWFTVWRSFGFPELEFVSRSVFWLASAWKPVRIPDALSWRESDVPLMKSALEAAAVALNVRKRDLSSARTRQTKKLLDTGSSRIVVSSFALEKITKANEEHERCLRQLQRHLHELGYVTEENRSVDLYCRLKSGPAIFEVKSIHEVNEISQVRSAIGQLYEYRYRESIVDASLWLVFSRKPTTDWLVAYLEVDRNIRVLWFDNSTLTGASESLLLESGSSALKRMTLGVR
jgi:hypothetical protein